MKKKINGKEAYKLLVEGREVYTTRNHSNPWSYKYIDGFLMFTKGSNPYRYHSVLSKEDIEEWDEWFIEEYNMAIDDVFHKNNINKFYRTEFSEVIYRLVENREADGLRLVISEGNEDEGCYHIGDDIEDVMYLDDILNLKFKEVKFH